MPRTPERLPAWGVALLLIVALTVMQVTVAASTALAGTASMTRLGLIQLLTFGFVLRLAAGLRGESLRHLILTSLQPFDAVQLGLAFVAGLALQLPVAELGPLSFELAPSLVPAPSRMAHIEGLLRVRGLDFVGAALALGVVAPLTEELLFRRALTDALALRMPRAWTVPLTAAVFALFHLDPSSVLPIFVVGLVLGGLAVRTGSLAAPIALHAGFNLVPLLAIAGGVSTPGLRAVDTGFEHVPVALWGPSLVSAAVSLTALVRRA